MKSRLVQLILILVVFVVGVMAFNSCSESTGSSDTTSGEGYIPPVP